MGDFVQLRSVEYYVQQVNGVIRVSTFSCYDIVIAIAGINIEQSMNVIHKFDNLTHNEMSTEYPG